MEKLTAEKLIEKLKESETSVSELLEIFDEGGDGDVCFGNTEIVHEQGDCEGGGDHSEKVIHFKDHDVYIRVTGFYSSYDGTDWDNDWSEVKPKEKTITVYE